MLVVAGLGNPGSGYAYHRHNIGFMAVDEIAHVHGFGSFRRRFQGQIAEGSIGGEKTLLLKPATFVNESGRSVGEALRFYKLPVDRLIVIYDELDLAPGKCRMKRGGGAGGHNGIRSIDRHVGPEYWRVRLGIGHPGNKALVRRYVLHDFASSDEAWLDPLMDAVAEAAPFLVKPEPDKFMTRVALAMQDA